MALCAAIAIGAQPGHAATDAIGSLSSVGAALSAATPAGSSIPPPTPPPPPFDNAIDIPSDPVGVIQEWLEWAADIFEFFGDRLAELGPDGDDTGARPSPPDATHPATAPTRYVITGGVDGDPHLRGFDLDYDLHLAGEFVLVRDPADGFEVQARFEPVADENATLTTAIAVDVLGTAVMVHADRVIVDGAEASGVVRFSTGATVTPTADEGVVIDWPDGARVQFDDQFVRLQLPAHRAGRLVGLLGNADDDPSNDFILRDGTVLADPDEIEIHRVFGESWRVADDESLFSYADGESTATFTMPHVPVQLASDVLAQLDADLLASAEAACHDAGVVEDHLLEACVFDVALTGDTGYADGSAESQAVLDRLRRGDISPVAPEHRRYAGVPVRLWVADTPLGAFAIDGLLMRGERDSDYGYQYLALAMTYDGHTIVRWASLTPGDYAPTGWRADVDGRTVIVDGEILAGVDGEVTDGFLAVDLGDGVLAGIELDGAVFGFVSGDTTVKAITVTEYHTHVGMIRYATDGLDFNSATGALPSASFGLLYRHSETSDWEHALTDPACPGRSGLYDGDSALVCAESVDARLDVIEQWMLAPDANPFVAPIDDEAEAGR